MVGSNPRHPLKAALINLNRVTREAHKNLIEHRYRDKFTIPYFVIKDYLNEYDGKESSLSIWPLMADINKLVVDYIELYESEPRSILLPIKMYDIIASTTLYMRENGYLKDLEHMRDNIFPLLKNIDFIQTTGTEITLAAHCDLTPHRTFEKERRD